MNKEKHQFFVVMGTLFDGRVLIVGSTEEVFLEAIRIASDQVLDESHSLAHYGVRSYYFQN